MNDLSLPNVEMISFKVQSAAIAASHWPMESQGPQSVSGTVSVSFTALAHRSDRPLPNGDLRTCEEAVRDALADAITKFQELTNECETLRAELLRVKSALEITN